MRHSQSSDHHRRRYLPGSRHLVGYTVHILAAADWGTIPDGYEFAATALLQTFLTQVYDSAE